MDFEFKFITNTEFWPLFEKYRPILFADNAEINISVLYSESENEKSKQLHKLCSNENKIFLYLTAWHENKLAGWSYGLQINSEEFYMCNSAVMPEYRRQKLYTEWMNLVVEKAFAEGFKEINSRHIADNNAVLIPKLKAGFVIKGFEINPRFGLLVNLVRYRNPAILDVHHQRTGFKK
jgi:ribosomal protein S18 acetylase RimI-like enzyme